MHHRAKLTDEDVILIRALREQYKLSMSVIAGKFEVTKSTVHSIVHYYTRPFAGVHITRHIRGYNRTNDKDTNNRI